MATRRSQARRYQAAARSTRRSLRAARRSARPLQSNPLVGWLVAGALLVALAFIVGGPAAEQGLLGGRSSPTPSAPASIPIRFGLAVDPESNRAIQRVGRFGAGQPFAYSVTLPAPPTTSTVFVEVERLSGPAPRIVQERTEQQIIAGRRTFALVLRTDDLLAAWGAGRFEMRIFLGQDRAPVASGRFRLVERQTT
jgi:hypothetical protein